MLNETQSNATKLVLRGKELFGNGQFALAAVCYQHAKLMYEETHDSPNSQQVELNYQECLELARQHGQAYEAVKELTPDVLLDTKLLQASLPSFSIEDLLKRAREQWRRENFRGMIETVRECQQFLSEMEKELAKQTRGYLDFYLGAAYLGLDRNRDAMPHLRASNHTMRELLHVYGEELWACCLLYLGQGLADSDPGNAERYLREAHDALLTLAEQQRAAGKSDRDTAYYTGMALLELARLKADQVIAGNTGAIQELLRNQQEAVRYLLPLRDAEMDDELRALYRKKINQALNVVDKTVDRIPPSTGDLLAAVADGCEIAFVNSLTDDRLAAALVRTAINACRRAGLDARAADVARSGRTHVANPELQSWLDGLIEEYEHRQGLETRLAAAKQAIAEGFFSAAYPDIQAATEHAEFLKDIAIQSQLKRLLAETRLRDPGLVDEYLEEIRPLLREGNFDEAERLLSRLRTAQGNNLALAEFRKEIDTAKTAIIEQQVKAMQAALEAGDLDGVEEAKNKAVALARQLPTEPPVLVEARRELVEGVMREHLRRAAECVQAGDFNSADEAFMQARGIAGDISVLAETLDAAEGQLQADRQAVIAREQRNISEAIAAGRYADANLKQATLLRQGMPLELPVEQQELLNEYEQARKRLLEAHEFASQGSITEADGAYRAVLLNPAAAPFRDEVQAEYDLLRKDWAKQHAGEAERLASELRMALGQRLNFKAARAALEGLDALIPGSYDEKAIRPFRHRYELMWALAKRNYCRNDLLFSGKPMFITIGLVVVDIVLCFFIGKLGWSFLPIGVIGLGLLAGAYGAMQCGAVKSMHAFTDKYHPFSLSAAGLLAALTAFGLSFKFPWGWIAGLVLGIIVFGVTELMLRNAMPIRVPE